jgi:predicted LPLAT superfamily acyltransferase
MMYQNGDNENASRYSMNDQLEKGNVRFINPAEPMNVIFEAVDVLNRREILLTMGDRVSGENSKYHEARMKGLKMRLPLGPWHIAYLTKAVVICIFIIKEKKEYRFIAQKPISFDYSGGISKKTAIINAVSTYAEYLEEMIYKYPFQWFNFAADVITARE